MKTNRTLFFLFLTLFLAACGKEEEKQTPVATPVATSPSSIEKIVGLAVIEPEGRISSLSPSASGVITRVEVLPNQEVQKGQLLFSLDVDVQNAQVAQAASRIRSQEAAIASAQAGVAAAEVRLAQAQANLDRTGALQAGGASTREQLDNDRFARDLAEKELANSRANLRSQQSRLDELKKDVAVSQSQVENRLVRAPSNGAMLTVDVEAGEAVSPGTTLGQFAPQGPLVAIMEVDELFASQVKVGQSAYVRQQGKDQPLAQGKVVLATSYLRKKSLFSDGAGGLEDRRVREVRVQLEPGTTLLIGSRVECVIQTQ
jgi:multidrug efflux pump subunit AcrA (membrane-fusion protein)